MWIHIGCCWHTHHISHIQILNTHDIYSLRHLKILMCQCIPFDSHPIYVYTISWAHIHTLNSFNRMLKKKKKRKKTYAHINIGNVENSPREWTDIQRKRERERADWKRYKLISIYISQLQKRKTFSDWLHIGVCVPIRIQIDPTQFCPVFVYLCLCLCERVFHFVRMSEISHWRHTQSTKCCLWSDRFDNSCCYSRCCCRCYCCCFHSECANGVIMTLKQQQLKIDEMLTDWIVIKSCRTAFESDMIHRKGRSSWWGA